MNQIPGQHWNVHNARCAKTPSASSCPQEAVRSPAVVGSGELSDPRAFTTMLIVSIAGYSVLGISFMN